MLPLVLFLLFLLPLRLLPRSAAREQQARLQSMTRQQRMHHEMLRDFPDPRSVTDNYGCTPFAIAR